MKNKSALERMSKLNRLEAIKEAEKNTLKEIQQRGQLPPIEPEELASTQQVKNPQQKSTSSPTTQKSSEIKTEERKGITLSLETYIKLKKIQNEILYNEHRTETLNKIIDSLAEQELNRMAK